MVGAAHPTMLSATHLIRMKIIKVKTGDATKALEALDRGGLDLSKVSDSVKKIFAIARRGATNSLYVEVDVKKIIKEVVARKDAAVIEYTQKFDGIDIAGR